MAKAARQRSKVVHDQDGRRLNRGDTFSISGIGKYRYLGTMRDGRVRVQFIPGPYAVDPRQAKLAINGKLEGCDLHLMEEEAIVLAALMRLVWSEREGTPDLLRLPGNGLDGIHDLSYWLERVSSAMAGAGYTLSDGRVSQAYFQLSDLLESAAHAGVRSADVRRGASSAAKPNHRRSSKSRPGTSSTQENLELLGPPYSDPLAHSADGDGFRG